MSDHGQQLFFIFRREAAHQLHHGFFHNGAGRSDIVFESQSHNKPGITQGIFTLAIEFPVRTIYFTVAVNSGSFATMGTGDFHSFPDYQ